MKKWQIKLLVISFLLYFGIPIYKIIFNRGVACQVIAPKILSKDKQGSLILQVADFKRGESTAKIHLIGGNTWSKEINLKQGVTEVPIALNEGAPAILYEVIITCRGRDYYFYGRIEREKSVAKDGLYVVTDRLRYRPGDKVRILGLNYSKAIGLFKKIPMDLKVCDGQNNIIWKKEILPEDGLMLTEIELSDKVNYGYWKVYLSDGKKEVVTTFSVEDFIPGLVDLRLKNMSMLFNDQENSLVYQVTHFAGGNLDGTVVDLRVEDVSDYLWEGSAEVKNGEAKFTIPHKIFKKQKSVNLTAKLQNFPNNEPTLSNLPVGKVNEAYEIKLLGEYVLETHLNHFEINLNRNDLEDIQGDFLIKTGGKNLAVEGKGGLLNFSTANLGETIELYKGNSLVHRWQTEIFYCRYITLEVQQRKQNVAGLLRWNRDYYGADRAGIYLYEKNKVIAEKTYKINEGNELTFSFDEKLPEAGRVECQLYRGKEKLVTIDKELVSHNIINEVKLSFSEKVAKPKEQVFLSASLKNSSGGVAAVIVADKALSHKSKAEGLQALNSQITPSINNNDKVASKVSKGVNESQLKNLDKQNLEGFSQIFRYLLIIMFFSSLVAFFFTYGRNKLVGILAFTFVLAIITAMLLPALGKARASSGFLDIDLDNVMASKNVSQVEEIRRDFKDNLLFAKVNFNGDGTFKIPVELADNLTTWRGEVLAFPDDKSVVYDSAELLVTKELFAEIDLPKSVVVGDDLQIVVNVFNKNPEPVQLIIHGDDKIEVGNYKKDLTGVEREAVSVNLKFKKIGQAKLLISVRSATNSDIQEQVIKVKSNLISTAKGHPLNLQNGQKTALKIYQEEGVENQTQQIVIYPGNLSETLEGVAGLIVTPSGCFEQVSSKNFPNVVAYEFLKKSGNTAGIEQRVLGQLTTGYQRLVSYEVSGGGFSLYGEAPASPWLTAYGILQFHLLSKHIYVDRNVLQRSWRYLKGKLSSMPMEEKLFALYCVKEAGLVSEEEGEMVYEQSLKALKSKNLWVAVLGASLLRDSKISSQTQQEIERVFVDLLGGKGYCASVNSRNSYGAVNGTLALAVEAAFYLNSPLVTELKNKLSKQKQYNTWGDTMSTALALKALSLFESSGTKELLYRLNGEKQRFVFDSKSSEAFYLPLKVDDQFELQLVKGDFLAAHLQTTWEESGVKKNRTVSDLVKISGEKSVVAGKSLVMQIEINNDAIVKNDPMLELPVPAGFVIDKEHLKRLQDERKIQFYEIREGNSLALYLNKLGENESVRLSINLTGKTAGIFSENVGKFYDYYLPEKGINYSIPAYNIFLKE